ncbi:MAG: HAMP domain-containing histidine kinase [Vicinamibacteria bacterium]|nr:HAMP domain-containing histidine kinase [Vicinamibacteria bacterium]
MISPPEAPPRRTVPWLALRLRFLVFVVLSVTVVALTVEEVGSRFTRQALEEEALAAAGATALGVADDLADQEALPTAPELEQLLVNYKQLVPTLRSLSVLEDQRKVLTLIATTSPRPEGDLVGLAARAVAARTPAMEASSRGPDSLRLVAAPLVRQARTYGAVVVGISLSDMVRTRQRIRQIQGTLVIVSALLIALLVDLVGQRLVFSPLRALRDAIGGALRGERGRRAPVLRADEIGDVTSAFNDMLTRIEGFSATLEAEVASATAKLGERNAELQSSVEQLFEARRELARSEMLAATGQMAATFAHKIGTPLALISGYVQLLLAEAPEGSERQERLRTVQEQIGRVTAIVRDLMNQTRTPLLRRVPTDAAVLLAGIARLVGPSAEQKGVSLEVDADEGPMPLLADMGQLEQVFLNLVTNALDAMTQGGRLTLRARADHGRIRFEVEDTGTGIDPALRSRIFEPLFTTKEPGRGTGLGLPIVRDVVLAHGGTVEVHSEPGQGARFEVTLPGGLGEANRAPKA